jgi:putative endonuclease
MTANRLRTGRLAEARAAEHLRSLGHEILERNARTRYGELDLVTLDPAAPDRSTLVFVEVKASRAGNRVGPERPVLWVTPRKQLQVRRLATAWMAEQRSVPRYTNIRFDAVGIILDRDDVVVDLEHLVGAF